MERTLLALLGLLLLTTAGLARSSELETSAAGRWPFFFGEALLAHSAETNTLLLGSKGGGIAVYDTELNRLARIDTGLGEIKRLVVSGDLLYVGGLHGIGVYDHAFAESLHPLAVYRTDTTIRHVEFLGDTAYLVLADNRLQSISLTDPTNPVPLGEHREFISGEEIIGFTLVDATELPSPYRTLAYVKQSSWTVIDFSDPTNPITVSTFDVTYDDDSLWVNGRYAYGNTGTILDLSDPTAPVEMPTVSDFYQNNYHFRFSGNHAFVTFDIYGRSTTSVTHIYDLSAPEAPVRVGSMGGVHDLVFVEDRAYSTQNGVLHEWDIAAPTSPELTNQREELNYGREIHLARDRAYVVGVNQHRQTSAIQIFDLSSPKAPRHAGEYDLDHIIFRDIAFHEDNAFILEREGVRIIDLSDPTRPFEITTWQPDFDLGSHVAIDVVDRTRAYITSDKQLHVVDISNVATPRRLSVYDFTEPDGGAEAWPWESSQYGGNDYSIRYAATTDRYVMVVIYHRYYLFREPVALQILDLSDPQHPRRVGTYLAADDGIWGSHGDLVVGVRGDHIYAAKDSALYAIDYGAPSVPYLAGQWSTDQPILDIEIGDKYAYLAHSNNIEIWNIASAEGPTSLHTITTSGTPTELALTDDHLLFIGGSTGPTIYDRPLKPIYRLYNTERRTHLLTADAGEKNTLDTFAEEFHFEFAAFHGYPGGTPGATPVHQFLNTESGVYFFTISAEERDFIENSIPAFVYQGSPFSAFTDPAERSVALHRFFSPSSVYHFFTASEGEKEYIIANLPEYIYDGVSFHVLP